MRLGLEVQIAIHLGHDARALQAQVQRPQRHNVARIRRRSVRLGYYARFLVDILEDGPVVLERLLARLLEHLAHVLCHVLAAPSDSLNGRALTASIRDMRHLAARHNVALCILNNLGRRQRRRLGGHSDRVHGAGGFEPWYNRRARALHSAGLEGYRKRSPAARAQHFGGSGAHDARLGELFLGLKRTCMKPISSAPLADLPPTHRAEPDEKTSPSHCNFDVILPSPTSCIQPVYPSIVITGLPSTVYLAISKLTHSSLFRSSLRFRAFPLLFGVCIFNL